MRKDLLKIKNKTDSLIKRINSFFRDKEIRNLDYSSLDEAVSIIEELVSKTNLEKYKFSYSFIFLFPKLVIEAEIYLLITPKRITHTLGGFSYSKNKHSALFLNFHIDGITFNNRIICAGVLKDIAKRKNLRFFNRVVPCGNDYCSAYTIEISLQVETLEYII
jgi:hypothetical protein